MSSLPLFSSSIKKQLANPKKIYAIDTGLINANTLSFSDDLGRILENIVYIELCRHKKEIFYHKSDYECDFVVRDANNQLQAVQVCYKLENENLDREINGIKELESWHLSKKLIITLNQDDNFGDIRILPAWQWLTE